jgi:tRNA nucleotidyltransferase (CCA-adding enzyme)
MSTELAALVPPPVVAICRRLKEAGFEAFCVGGAVRDALLGRVPGDWDVTTSAHPDEVVDLFQRTVPTGIDHGTVTVIERHMPVEVTTFRGEGAYSDARRPDEVVFGVPLREDLARRDFVINAIAYDPIDDRLEDPFGGAADIEAGLVRAVGDPRERFTEDGLRVMRAVRFVAVLDFALATETEEALAAALPSLARVARERVRVELLKLLAGPAALRALEIARRRGVLESALPLTSRLVWPAAGERVERCPADAVLRLAALLFREIDAAEAEPALRDLTLSNADRQRVMRALSHGAAPTDAGDAALRRHLGRASRAGAADLVTLWRAAGDGELADRAAAILEAGDPLVAGELAIGGRDITAILGIEPGPVVGRLIAALLDEVHRDPAANHRETLAGRIPDLYAKLTD